MSGYVLNPWTNSYIPDELEKQYHSKRFGPWAYAAPLHETEPLKNLARWLGYDNYNQDNNAYTFNYGRTGRALGTGITDNSGKLSYKSADKLFDYLDSYSKQLDQYDPDYFHYESQPGESQQNAIDSIIGAMTNLTSTRNYAPPKAGTRQLWNNPVFDALSMFTVQ